MSETPAQPLVSAAELAALAAEFNVETPLTVLGAHVSPLPASRPAEAPPLTVLWVSPPEYSRVKDHGGTSVLVPADVGVEPGHDVLLLRHSFMRVPTNQHLWRAAAAVYGHGALASDWRVVDLRKITPQRTTTEWRTWVRAVAEHARTARLRRLTA